MDSTLDALRKRFPCMVWEPETDGWIGVCGSVCVKVGADEMAGAWAHGWLSGTDTSIGATAADAVQAVEKLTIHKAFSDALRLTPPKPEPPPQPEYSRYPDAPPKVERFSFGYIFWNIAKLWVLGEIKAALRSLSSVTWGDAVALLLLFVMALGCGALGMWWLSGGA